MNNLLEACKIDVIVEFTERGPSRNLYSGDKSVPESSMLSRMELASLWEIEPPTEDERQLYEVLKRLGHTESEDESDALMEQLRTLSRRVEAQKRPVTLPTGQGLAEAPLVFDKPKVCYVCKTKPARAGSAFCSDACANAAAERYVQETTRGWCSVCGKWLASEGCPHSN